MGAEPKCLTLAGAFCPELERAIGGFFIELCTRFQNGIDPKERCGNIDRLFALSANLSPLPAGKSHGGLMELPLLRIGRAPALLIHLLAMICRIEEVAEHVYA